MKQCPRCRRTYTEDDLNFCLDDGELLASLGAGQPQTRFVDDSPPTLTMDPTRVTNPTNFPVTQAPVQWQQPMPMGQRPIAFGSYAGSMGPNQTLAVVSLCLGIASITVGWCCSLGLLLSPAALITGGIALAQNKSNPQSYGGKGMAIGGMAAGGVFILAYIILIILYGAALFLTPR